MNDLLPFLIRAKKATYVGNGIKAAPSRVGAHDLTYEEGEFTYRDSYFGGTDFIGQDVVWITVTVHLIIQITDYCDSAFIYFLHPDEGRGWAFNLCSLGKKARSRPSPG